VESAQEATAAVKPVCYVLVLKRTVEPQRFEAALIKQH
jgi:hypothetical protein